MEKAVWRKQKITCENGIVRAKLESLEKLARKWESDHRNIKVEDKKKFEWEQIKCLRIVKKNAHESGKIPCSQKDNPKILSKIYWKTQKRHPSIKPVYAFTAFYPHKSLIPESRPQPIKKIYFSWRDYMQTGLLANIHT